MDMSASADAHVDTRLNPFSRCYICWGRISLCNVALCPRWQTPPGTTHVPFATKSRLRWIKTIAFVVSSQSLFAANHVMIYYALQKYSTSMQSFLMEHILCQYCTATWQYNYIFQWRNINHRCFVVLIILKWNATSDAGGAELAQLVRASGMWPWGQL